MKDKAVTKAVIDLDNKTFQEESPEQLGVGEITVPLVKVRPVKTVVASWNGGIAGCLALSKAVKDGLKVEYLYTAVSEIYRRVSTYGVKEDIINLQAESMGLTTILKRTNYEDYELPLIESLTELEKKGVRGMVFGDIDPQDDIDLHENWVWGQHLCRKVGIEANFPLTKIDQRELLREFISLGFKAIVVAVNSKFFGPETLGRPVDESWIKELDKLGNVTYCGSEGEYYTMAYDGPLFKKKMNISQGRETRRNGYWILDIQT